MAAGDVQRVWFEEMIATLRSKWQRGLAFEELIRLRDDLDEMLQQIRAERQIPPLVFKCRKCGHIGEGAAPRVNVRAMILSVIRFEIDDSSATRAVEKQWKAYQKENRLDLNGKLLVTRLTGLHRHPAIRISKVVRLENGSVPQRVKRRSQMTGEMLGSD